MKYEEITPQEYLRQYVKCFFIIESDEVIEYESKVLPGGYPELIFNLSDVYLHSEKEERFNLTPPIDYLGQLTRPLAIKSKGKLTMLGIRFYAHAAAYFLKERMEEFNDQISDLTGLLHTSTKTLYEQLMETKELKKKIALIEYFLLNRLSCPERRFDQINLVGDITRSLAANNYSDNVDFIAKKYGISNRYLQKLFLQHTGLTPKSFLRINRFHHSLSFLDNKKESLTSIAYSCGYFDQSHFIKEFKLLSGETPLAYLNAKAIAKT
ncbi:helix-turn-helix protein [Chitinophaga niastensis]|uniref:Helix-turn-helix protein n=1 Tax=Chitinophaga niastensis TaxID=536980 RepID=A0A2P8HVU1_CHINA|nr:helix-turn-helix transcriptional regulator [Chitinophaga niastensis]PSL50347.1 helix-turn-helix protein [Chitinophaga niastensis]